MNTSPEENARKEDPPNADEPGQEAPAADGATVLPENGTDTGTAPGPDAPQDGARGAAPFPQDPDDPAAPGEQGEPVGPDGSVPHDADDPSYDADPRDDADDEPFVPAAPKEGGIFSAETFAITAVMLTTLSLIGTRVGQMLSSITASPTDQLSGATNLLLGDAGTALIGVLLGGLSLLLHTTATRPWARWAAAAAIILGIIAILIGGAAVMLLPEPQPMQPGMQPGM